MPVYLYHWRRVQEDCRDVLERRPQAEQLHILVEGDTDSDEVLLLLGERGQHEPDQEPPVVQPDRHAEGREAVDRRGLGQLQRRALAGINPRQLRNRGRGDRVEAVLGERPSSGRRRQRQQPQALEVVGAADRLRRPEPVEHEPGVALGALRQPGDGVAALADGLAAAAGTPADVIDQSEVGTA